MDPRIDSYIVEPYVMPHAEDTTLRYDYSQHRSGSATVTWLVPQPTEPDAVVIEQIVWQRSGARWVPPSPPPSNPPSEASWRWSDWAVAAIAVGACAAMVFGGLAP